MSIILDLAFEIGQQPNQKKAAVFPKQLPIILAINSGQQ